MFAQATEKKQAVRPGASDPRAAASHAGIESDLLRQHRMIGNRAMMARETAAAGSFTSYEAQDCPGPVSEGETPVPAPAPPVAPTAPAPPAPPVTMTTRTLLAAPNGAANTRTTVGVNEQVAVTASAAVTWTATAGTITPANGLTATWTAPDTATACTITGTPATGAAASVPMTVIRPASRQLTKSSDRAYTAGKAGSGFVADVVIMPTTVSFSRIEVREQTVNATATGYYNTVLGWNNIAHPLGSWLAVNSANSGIIDTVGTTPPGSGGTFAAGTFVWAIPQEYRAGATGTPRTFSTGTHRQVMAGATGEETTSKEGASRTRTP
ncbi:hypothetical protein JCM14469_06090 [Desulfatiferula olefinivorans]